MSFRIQTNTSAMYANRQLNIINTQMEGALEKLSSGYRINHAADDAAGLAISEKLRTQVNGLDQAARNVQDGISLIQTAEGGMEELHLMLQRMRTLAIQSANDTNTASDRALIQTEVTQLLQEVNRMQTTVVFNGKQLLSGSYASGTGNVTLHVGADASQTLAMNIGSMSTTGLGINAINISTQSGAETAITSLTAAINTVSTNRANLGAMQNRLEHTYNFVQVAEENMSASESRIRDVDMAAEMVDYTKYQVLTQAATAMLSQANTRSGDVLALFS
ncbi:MAG TPA: flagellin [bacterium]|nr:flagellin [bacterium]